MILGDIAKYSSIVSMICIIAIGVLLVEYMDDGTIYNHAFSGLCIVAIGLHQSLPLHKAAPAGAFRSAAGRSPALSAQMSLYCAAKFEVF